MFNDPYISALIDSPEPPAPEITENPEDDVLLDRYDLLRLKYTLKSLCAMKNYYFPKFTFPTKQELRKAWADWFDSLKKDHELLAITIVFSPKDSNNSQARWEGEYKEGVLRRFKRALERSEVNQEIALPFDDFYYFERNECSIYRTTGSRKPFHIHALLPIRKSQFYRVWSSDNNNVKDRLMKDIYSLGTIQSVLVEKVADGKTMDWTSYITKMKPI